MINIFEKNIYHLIVQAAEKNHHLNLYEVRKNNRDSSIHPLTWIPLRMTIENRKFCPLEYISNSNFEAKTTHMGGKLVLVIYPGDAVKIPDRSARLKAF